MADRLWVPLLSHYRQGEGGVTIDMERVAAHVGAIRPDVGQFLLAGSTGDGWEFGWDTMREIVDLSRRSDLFDGTRVLFGALRPTTDEVVAWAKAIEDDIRTHGCPAGSYEGLAVCPPVDPDADQATILEHYQRILAATESPIAVYQLPQVTGCSIEPDTMRLLAREDRVSMFKDTSGTDTIATAGVDGVLLVRGAEGGYVDALKPHGPYDGWLLSTGNAFGAPLRRMLELIERGEIDRAKRLSGIVTSVVEALFAEAANVPFGNPFSNANRAADHLWAYGSTWRDRDAPLTASGNRLPQELLEAAQDLIGLFPALPNRGYLTA